MQELERKWTEQIAKLNGRVSQVLNYHRASADDFLETPYLWHFTRYDVLVSLLKKLGSVFGEIACAAPPPRPTVQKLRMTDASSLNDPLEGQALTDFCSNGRIDVEADVFVGDADCLAGPRGYKWKDIKAALGTFAPASMFNADQKIDESNRLIQHDKLSRYQSKIFTTSFSTSGDVLALWVAYGDHGRGAAFKIPTSELLSNGVGYKAYFVAYGDDDKANALRLLCEPLCDLARTNTELSELETLSAQVVGSAVRREQVFSAIHELLFVFKHVQFGHEAEVRIIRRGANPRDVSAQTDTGRVFVETETSPIGCRNSSVLLGPVLKKDTQKCELIRLLSGSADDGWPQIEESEVHYRH